MSLSTVTVTYPLNLLPLKNPPSQPPSSAHVTQTLTKSDLTITYPIPSGDELDEMPVGKLCELGLATTEYREWAEANKAAKFKSGAVTVSIKGATLHSKPLKMDWLCEDVGIVHSTELVVTDADVNGQVKAHRSSSFVMMEGLIAKGGESSALMEAREEQNRVEQQQKSELERQQAALLQDQRMASERLRLEKQRLEVETMKQRAEEQAEERKLQAERARVQAAGRQEHDARQGKLNDQMKEVETQREQLKREKEEREKRKMEREQQEMKDQMEELRAQKQAMAEQARQLEQMRREQEEEMQREKDNMRQSQSEALRIEREKLRLEEDRIKQEDEMRKIALENERRKDLASDKFNEPLDLGASKLKEKSRASKFQSKNSIKDQLLKRSSKTEEEGGAPQDLNVPPPVPEEPKPDPISLEPWTDTAPPAVPAFAERGTFGRVSEMPKDELAIERRLALWDLLDEVSSQMPKALVASTRNPDRKVDHKKHTALPVTLPPSSSGAQSSNQLFVAKMKEALDRDAVLYGKGYSTAVQLHMKEVQAGTGTGKKKRSWGKKKAADDKTPGVILEQVVTYDVLVHLMGKWEEDEKTKKSIAHESSPPRRASKMEKPIPRKTLSIAYEQVVQEIDISAMTPPSVVLKQFVDKIEPSLMSTWDDKAVKKSIEEQLLSARAELMRAETRRIEEIVQAHSDKLQTVGEIKSYSDETIGDLNAMPKTEEELSPERETACKQIAKNILKVKRELRKKQKRRMTISANRPLLPPELLDPNSKEAKKALKEKEKKEKDASIFDKDEISMEELFAYVDKDGDGSIDEKEWGVFMVIRKKMQQKGIDERNKLIKTQDMLKEKLKNAPPEIQQQDLKYREYANKKKALVEKVETIMKQNEVMKEQITEAEQRKKDKDKDAKPSELVERFSKVIIERGLDEFERILNGAILDDSDDEDEYVSHSALKLTLQMMNIDYKQFNIKDILAFFGKYNRGVVTKKGCVDGIKVFSVKASDENTGQ
ncbi:hypothetical protein TrVE_jg13694 [Triparma verrucosa]|uniref:EF-hand domain-containing protein n=1 Tax=Triparma verrucosa TaxID=1606542 RepID=A0A9W7BYP6_9STRA|nr:hypothetical protein TrVE_jg13694 [Triparma verrucosa]